MSEKANSRTGRIPELNEDINLEDLLQLGEDIFPSFFDSVQNPLVFRFILFQNLK
jgi:hypothetical protein